MESCEVSCIEYKDIATIDDLIKWGERTGNIHRPLLHFMKLDRLHNDSFHPKKWECLSSVMKMPDFDFDNRKDRNMVVGITDGPLADKLEDFIKAEAEQWHGTLKYDVPLSFTS